MYIFKHLAKKNPTPKTKPKPHASSPPKPNKTQPPRENKHQTSYPETEFGPADPLGIWKSELNLPIL